MNKKIILIGSAIVLSGIILFLILSNNTINATEIIESKDKYAAATTGLNLRLGPDKSSKLISVIPFGTKVTIEKSEGDEIKPGELFFEINTDKTTMQVEATLDGIVLKIMIAEGDTVPVFTPIAVVGKAGESAESALAALPISLPDRGYRYSKTPCQNPGLEAAI